MHWILGIILAVALFYILRGWSELPEEKRKAYLFRGVAGGFALLMLFMVLTGRVQVLVAGVAALIPFLRKLPALFKYLPLVNRLYSQYKGQKTGGQQQSGGQQRAPEQAGMSVAQAREILGVDANASRDEIVAAHRRLIQKVHPDRGGNDYLAAQINEAKAVLLGGKR
ncbi:molecular chaperone DnaJ [Marinobacter sp. R17]|uniref:DnaJ domain-containing protein n=1 Tax=Marinobacter TaxID=2742 RepID=UPI000F4B4623|nr:MULTISPECIES: DnaJ domain-containing protein [Marinobacter]ROT95745.1 molecular chaperone DnaJ [Marinobacter sp. R17]